MEVSSLTIILVAMAIGLIVGFEVGQNFARKQLTNGLRQLIGVIQKQAEDQKQIEKEQKKDGV